MKPLIIDIETSIGKGVHSNSRDPNNDFYTLIYGERPDEIKVEHNVGGFKRMVGSKFDNIDVIVGHNLSFDLSYFWTDPSFQRFIRRGGTIWDTQESEYVLSGQRHKFASLSELQQIHLGEKTKLSRISGLFNKGHGADQILAAKDRCKRVFALYERYCYDDGASTLKVFKAQYMKAKEEGMLNIVKLRNKALLAIIMMQNSGIHIDKIKCEQVLRDFRLTEMEALRQSEEIVKDKWDEKLGKFNVNSPKQKSAMLFGGTFLVKEKELVGKFKNGNDKYATVEKELHIEGFKVPKSMSKEGKLKGVYCTDAKVIHKIADKTKNPVLKEYCELQKKAMKYNKMASTYLEPFLNYSVDGVLYPNYNTTATETGRLSSSKPNLQNVPASGEMLVPIQGQLIAPQGWKCVDIDYNQLEPFVTAFLSRDTALTEDLLNGVCLHCRAVSWIPRMAEGKTYEEIYQLAKVEEQPEWVLKRKKAKAVNFKRAYGGGAKSLAEAENIPIEDVQAIFDAQDAYYSGVKRFNEGVLEKVKDNQELSIRKHYSRVGSKGREFKNGLELLPIFNKAEGTKTYRGDELRHFGKYKSPTGALFTFEEYGEIDNYGRFKRAYSSTQTKNYQIQGTAAVIVNMAMAECFQYVLQNDDVKLVGQIHDSLRFYIKEDKLGLHIPKICEIMEDIPAMCEKYLNMKADFKFVVEAKVGANFAETEVYKTGEKQ